VKAALLLVFVLILSRTPPAGAEARRPTLFLSCPQGCFDDYLRQQLSYFDLVRDRHQADWTLFIVRQAAASGGERTTLTVFPRPVPPSPPEPEGAARSMRDDRGEPSAPARHGPPVSREVTSRPGATEDEQRQQVLDAALQALYLALFSTEHAPAFRLSLPGREGNTLSQLDDPWNYWVIAPELAGAAEASNRSQLAQLEAALTLRRITDLDKLTLMVAYARYFSRYILEDGTDARGDIPTWDFNAVYARSVGSQWALGSTVTGEGDPFENLKVHVHFGPVVEYNFFPYAQNATAQLRVAYQAGLWANWYDELSVLGELRELRPYHALALIADINQPWGSIQLGTQLNSFIDQPAQLRWGGVAEVSLQLFEGFALNVSGNVAWIRDQISLRGREVTDVELLLGTTQLPATYDIGTEIGFSYTFGSVHNTIVNPRFGRLDLVEE